MTTIPATIVDDFLENPNQIEEWALSLEYNPDPEGNWPGKRSKNLKELNFPFFNYLKEKVISLFYDTQPLHSDCDMFFQLIENYTDTGWIHQDFGNFASILYLSNPKENCGTTLYKLKKFFPFVNKEEYNFRLKRLEHHQKGFINKTDSNLKKTYEKNNFKKILEVPSKFNRLFCFSSEHFHSANNFSSLNSPLRLTLFMNFYNISHIRPFPIIRSKQTLMI